MHHSTKKWIFTKISSIILIPFMIWFLVSFVSIYDKGYLEIIDFFSSRLSKVLFSLLVVIAFFFYTLTISEIFEDYVKDLNSSENISKIIIGNGTGSDDIKGKLDFLKKEIITFEEKNTTYRAKARYFELFPISGLKALIPREVFILNKNLDAIAALIILEDYCKIKFTLNKNIDFKTWLK